MSSPSFMISSRRLSPGLPVFDRVAGKRETDDRYLSKDVSNADSAVDRANACENEYRAKRVSFGYTDSGREEDSRESASFNSGV